MIIKGLSIEEYREWLKENGNQEEKMALEVVDKIIFNHITCGLSDKYKYDIKLYPRHILKSDRIRIEFDLIISVELTSKKTKKRYIGVEFKEYDISKVIDQAIIRRNFVDYMYIATRPNIMQILPQDLYKLVLHGIGWVIWTEPHIVIMMLKSRKGRSREDY